LEIRSGVLRFQIVGMDPTEYVTTCLFLGDPASPALLSTPASQPKKLLQPFALVNDLRFVFDKDSTSGSLYGDVIVEKK
jgi:hypothetical protein